MYKTISLSVALLFVAVVGQGQGIRFEEGTWPQVLAIAKKENKPIFVDAYTEWCIPCKRMDREVFSRADVGMYINERFIAYKMDMEKGEGVEFAQKYGVNAFPTLVYFDSNGEMINKSVGYKDAERLIAVSEEALDPANSLDNLHRDYQTGGKSLGELLEYGKKLRQADQFGLAQNAARHRLSRLRKNEKYSKEAWQLISTYINDYDDPLFIKLVKQKKRFAPVANEGELSAYIHHVLSNRSLLYRNREDNGRSLATYIRIVEGLKTHVNSPYYIARANYFTHLERTDSLQFKHALAFFDGDFTPDHDDGNMPYFLAFIANRYIDEDTEKQAAAMRWARKSIDLDGQDYKNKFVLARLLHNKGQLKEALAWAEKALDNEQSTKESGMIKALFAADKIPEFIDKIKSEIE